MNLTNHELDRIQILLKDDFLLEILEKVFLTSISEYEPKVSETNDDIQLGQKYRAYDTSKEILAQAFIKLLSLKMVESSKSRSNPAR
jgi:hypothetical protein